jgi:Arc/MetJ-type ribon-helix-helix transcriptional regulator
MTDSDSPTPTAGPVGDESDDATGGERTITLPEPLVDGIERRVERTEFDSVEEYAAFALDLLVRAAAEDDERDVDGGRDDTDGRRSDATPADAGAVEDRLDALGYR